MRNIRVLVACERSGVVRRAFQSLGYEAWSCDIEQADDKSNHHITGDVRDHLNDGWDLMTVMHPPCTVLCNSGAKHLYLGGRKENGKNPERWERLEEAASFYRELRDASQIPCRSVENPIMHGAAIELTGRGETQFVQPWWFGDPYFKATGFEMINLPKLAATNRLTPPKKGTEEHKKWSMIHRAAPGPERAKIRSQTFPGVAHALAHQLGSAAAQYANNN